MEVAVRVTWDPEACVWVAESDDVPGLVIEADDVDALVARLKVLIPELLEANDVALPEQDEIAFVPDREPPRAGAPSCRLMVDYARRARERLGESGRDG